MSIIKHLVGVAQGKHPMRKRRSSEWPKLRRQHLEVEPFCAVCGSDQKVEPHHIKPFHLHPELELDPSNLITLCESRKSMNCHLVFGHCDNFQRINPDVVRDSQTWNAKLKAAKYRQTHGDKM